MDGAGRRLLPQGADHSREGGAPPTDHSPKCDPVPPAPAGLVLVPDRTTRVVDGGRALVGGTPTRLLRLRARAAELTAAWFAGAPLSGDQRERHVARRLLDAGLAHPRPRGKGPSSQQLTVVVPVKDRPAHLARLLASLEDLAVVVVDDGSERQGLVEAVAARFGARCVTLDRTRGPSGARNAGLAATTTPFVAFVDSDCTARPGWVAPLMAHFADPAVGAVAPRVVAGPPIGRRWLDAYEMSRSPLDRGDREGIVRPGSPVHFVPAAALIVRRAAVADPCFDEELARGEDVDFVWRLAAAGWTVRYVPASTVCHETRPDARSWLRQRVGYGATAGPLARRHGRSVAPMTVPPLTAAAWGLAATSRPLAAAAVTATATALLARRLRGVVARPVREAARLAVPGTWSSAVPGWAGLLRAHSPALAAGLVTRRFRWAAVAGLLGPGAVRWWVERPQLDPLRYTVAHAADDLAYGVGLWAGCVRARTVRPLVPHVPWRPAGSSPPPAASRSPAAPRGSSFSVPSGSCSSAR